MLQELHRIVLHRSSKYSQERAGIPMQEGPLSPEGAPRGNAYFVASWLGRLGKLFVLAAPTKGRPFISPHLITITHTQGQP